MGRLFHWGSLHADGMREPDREIVLKAWEGYRGQVFRSGDQELDKFVRKFFRPLRKGENLADCAIEKTDTLSGTVDVYLTFVWNPNIVQPAAKMADIIH
jgi:hypothetical protein